MSTFSLISNRMPIRIPFPRMRALRCYIYLLIWIIAVSAGLYYYLSSLEYESAREIIKAGGGRLEDVEKFHPYANEDKSDDIQVQAYPVIPGIQFVHSDSSQVETDITYEFTEGHSSIKRICNSQELIQAKDENFQHPSYTLDAIVIIFRHGDRGPLYVGTQNVSLVNCKGELHADYPSLERFVSESMTKLPGYSQFIGPFHSFAKVPNSHFCHLGQLTKVGSSQLLHLGQMIRSTYQSTLPFRNININGGGDSGGRVVAYCTRYRRTLQSLMAFLFGLLGPKLLVPAVTIRESQSINFCFNDCSCRAVNRLQKDAMRIFTTNAKSDDKAERIRSFGYINGILGLEHNWKTGFSLLDLLLLYPCHNAPLPCRVKPQGAELESNDCVTNKDLTKLVLLLRKEGHGLHTIRQQRQFALLNSYGLLKEILGISLKMTSSVSGEQNGASRNQKSRIAIFSGHDTTLQNFLGGLGVFSGHPDLHLPPYASRLILEFYKKTNVSPNSPRKHFFRVIYNGHSITHWIYFCKNEFQRTKKESGIEPKDFLCPLENFVRFLHNNYFDSFGNSTNFRDACRSISAKKTK